MSSFIRVDDANGYSFTMSIFTFGIAVVLVVDFDFYFDFDHYDYQIHSLQQLHQLLCKSTDLLALENRPRCFVGPVGLVRHVEYRHIG